METSLLFFSFVSSWTLYPNKILSPLSDQYYLRFRNFKWWLIISMNPSITSILWVLNALEYPTPPSLTSEKDSVSRSVKTQPIGYFLFFFQIHLGDYIQEIMALTSLVNVSFMRTSWEVDEPNHPHSTHNTSWPRALSPGVRMLGIWAKDVICRNQRMILMKMQLYIEEREIAIWAILLMTIMIW